MRKILTKLGTLLCLVLIGLAGLLLLLENKTGLVKAKEDIKTVIIDRSTDPGARPALASFNITVNEIVASGFTRPVQVTHAGDGSGRLFVVEQDGRIKIIKNGTTLSTDFLNITNTVRGPTEGGGEEGLLGLAFHPNYETNGFFYVYYNNTSSNIVIARYTASPPSSDTANAGSASIILPIAHPTNENHNGGQLAFSPVDGYLYIGTGDGGGGGDTPNNAQTITSLLGKILRIDVNSGSPYTSPNGNPFKGVAGADEIWALGVRNPFRFSFDRANGDLYIGDVGQGAWEEVSYQAGGTPGGVNFGWRCREGAHDFNFEESCESLTLTDPIAEYANPPSGLAAVTGGFVYRGSQYAALVGYYFYADFYTGAISSTRKTGSTFSTPELELDTSLNISAFGEDEQGELYVVDYGGSIRRLADVNGPSSNLSASHKSASSPGIDPGETLTYTILIKNINSLTSSEPVFLSDRIPTGLAYVPGSLAATQGTVDASQNPTLRWQGILSPANSVTVTYRVTATGVVTGILLNQAVITSASLGPITRTYPIFVPRPFSFYWPILLKSD